MSGLTELSCFGLVGLFELMAVQSLKNRLFYTASKNDLVDDKYRNHILVDIASFHGFRVQATTLEQTTPLWATFSYRKYWVPGRIMPWEGFGLITPQDRKTHARLGPSIPKEPCWNHDSCHQKNSINRAWFSSIELVLKSSTNNLNYDK